jgi:pimeloyl-ACP methyl ester carboxylesterase
MTAPALPQTMRMSRRESIALAMASAALAAAPALAATQREMNMSTANNAVRPFRVSIPDAALDDLHSRVLAARWPSKELVEDRSQGVQLATMRELARYWASEYDWRRCEARLNAFPHFKTTIDGVEIHFIHVRSRHENALPLIMTHGWPGSVIEMLDTIGPLTDPTAHGGTAADAFHLVLPSLPGYGFSGGPAELGWNSDRIARAWAVLMERLGYTNYVAQGGDVGANVTDAMGRQAPAGLAGIHLSLLSGALAIVDRLPANTEQERAAHSALASFRTTGFGYFLEQSTRPQTIGYSLLDSPIGLAAWLLDHDTDSYYKISRAFIDGRPTGRLTRETILDNITLYWLTSTGATAARWYWEFGQVLAAAATGGAMPPPVSVPVGFTAFPGEIWFAPRSWVEAVYPGLTYFNAADRGGHFAAWEEPMLFTSELRAAFRTLRRQA